MSTKMHYATQALVCAVLAWFAALYGMRLVALAICGVVCVLSWKGWGDEK